MREPGVMGWAKIKPAALYAGVSERTMRSWLKKGLRHSRLPSGTVLVKLSSIDSFLDAYCVEDQEVDRVVDEVISQMEAR